MKTKLDRLIFFEHHGEDETLAIAKAKPIAEATFMCIARNKVNKSHRLFRRKK